MIYATTQDVINLFRPLSEEEANRSEHLIEVVCDSLRLEAQKVGKDLDELIMSGDVYENVVKSVVVDIVARTLMTSTTAQPMTQYSESGGGYAVSGTFLNPGGGLFIKKSELARLGLRKQRYGVIDLNGAN